MPDKKPAQLAYYRDGKALAAFNSNMKNAKDMKRWSSTDGRLEGIDEEDYLLY